jgi:hypothetical protein
MDLIDDVLDGTTPVTGIDINSGTIDNAVIGGTTPVAGTFSTLTANTSLGVTGNITVSGTVDGRDVAADGTKLDGIESGATADQTAAEIRTLVESATDSNVFTDADHTKLNGIETGATADQTASEILTAIKTVDGSGSGLDADLWDGNQFSSYLNQAVLSTSSPSFAGVNINGNLSAVDNIYLANNLYHEGDTDTRLLFGTNTITLQTGGSSEITVNTSGVRLGDTGNGYFQPVTGNYGSIQIDGGAHGGWEGYSIGARAVFMHDNASTMGLFDDVNNHWVLQHTFNGATQLYYDGVSKLRTNSGGVNIDGSLNAVDNIYLAGNLYHEGDTDTRLDFGTNTINLRAANAHEVQITNNGMFLVNSALHEDYDGLSGTSPSVDPNSGGAWALTMTGNTTFTFGATSNNYSTGIIIELTGNGSTVTWPSSVEWAGGTAPDAPASGETDIYVFWTRNGGTTWYGVQSIDAAA